VEARRALWRSPRARTTSNDASNQALEQTGAAVRSFEVYCALSGPGLLSLFVGHRRERTWYLSIGGSSSMTA
jgi:hypothetical protein